MSFVEIRSLKESPLPGLFIPNVLLIATFPLSIWSTTGTSENVGETRHTGGYKRCIVGYVLTINDCSFSALVEVTRLEIEFLVRGSAAA